MFFFGAVCVCVMSLFRVCFMVIDDWNQWNEIRIRKSSHALCGILVRTLHTHTWPKPHSNARADWSQAEFSEKFRSSVVHQQSRLGVTDTDKSKNGNKKSKYHEILLALRLLSYEQEKLADYYYKQNSLGQISCNSIFNFLQILVNILSSTF